MPCLKPGSRAAGLAAVLSSALLAACVQSVPVDLPDGPVATRPQQPRGVEGDWYDPKGIRSSFNSGAFETRTTDTNQKLASGSYTMTDPRTVQITVQSLIRNTTSNVTCLMVGPGQLNCTSSGGQQFVLTRRAA